MKKDNMKELIERLFAHNQIDKVIEHLDKAIEQDPANAELWYLRGRAYWRKDQRGKAISDYEESVFLDPNSPAKHALEMARGIMDFFNPDMMNP